MRRRSSGVKSGVVEVWDEGVEVVVVRRSI